MPGSQRSGGQDPPASRARPVAPRARRRFRQRPARRVLVPPDAVRPGGRRGLRAARGGRGGRRPGAADRGLTGLPDRAPAGRRRQSSMASGAALPDDLVALAAASFRYFADEVNPGNGLIPDSTRRGAPSSIAAVGFALSAYPVAVDPCFLPRGKAAAFALAALYWLRRSPQGEAPDATGYRGFYYHFLDMKSGRRAGRCERPTLGSA